MTASLPDKEFRDHAILSEYTTFQLGGKCRALILCRTEQVFLSVMREIHKRRERHVVLGGGSNIIFPQKGVDATVIQYLNNDSEIKQYGSYLVVPASYPLDDVSRFAAEQGLGGLEFATGIPGTIGGAVCGNAGAFGHQISDIINSVRVFTQQCTVRESQRDEMKFGYRSSRIQNNREVILSTFLSLTETDSAPLLAERERILALRRECHPDWHTTPCSGCVFRNVEQEDGTRISAGKLLDEAGAKSMRVGGAAIFEKHANIIVKADESCTSDDVYQLALQMQQAVKEKHNIELVPEIRFVDHIGQPLLLEP